MKRVGEILGALVKRETRRGQSTPIESMCSTCGKTGGMERHRKVIGEAQGLRVVEGATYCLFCTGKDER